MLRTEIIAHLEAIQSATKPMFEVNYPDYAVSHDETMTKKIPGLFSTKKVPLGSMTPTFKKEGEDFRGSFYKAPSEKAKYKDEKAPKEKVVKENGKTDISDLHFLPAYGYPALLYDDEAIRKLDIKTLTDDMVSSDKWNSADLRALIRLLNSKPIKTWTKTELKHVFAAESGLESDHDWTDPVPVYDLGSSKYTKIPFGFCTKFYQTDAEDKVITATNETKWIPLMPVNPVTVREPLTMYFMKLVNNYYVVAVAMKQDQVVLLKVDVDQFNVVSDS